MASRMPALSERNAARSSRLRRDNCSSCPTIDDTFAIIRRKACVVMQKPSGT